MNYCSCLIFGILALESGNAISQDDPKEKIPLVVKYVGSQKSERGRSFVGFLTQNFTRVDFVNRHVLKTPEDSIREFKKCDVLIIDADLTGKLPNAYGKPMVVISGSGQRTAESIGSKLDWL